MNKMQINDWTRRPKRIVSCWLMCALALLLAGCGSSKESLYELDHETPPHWPSDLQDAVRKISERLSIEESDQGYPLARKELLDLATWAAELTADTDMPEAEWMPVYELSETIRHHLNAPDVSIDECRDDFQRLQALLTEADVKYARVSRTVVMPQDSTGTESSGVEEPLLNGNDSVHSSQLLAPDKMTSSETVPGEQSLEEVDE